jgi:hypothetical protein
MAAWLPVRVILSVMLPRSGTTSAVLVVPIRERWFE